MSPTGIRSRVICSSLPRWSAVGPGATLVTGKTVTLTVRYADFTTFSRQQVQFSQIWRSEEIYQAALKICDSLILDQPIRLLGVRAVESSPSGPADSVVARRAPSRQPDCRP